MSEDNKIELNKLEFTDLKSLATSFKISYKGNVSRVALESQVEDFIEANPGCMEEGWTAPLTEDEIKAKEDAEAQKLADEEKAKKLAEEQKAKEGMVSIQSIYRGTMGTSMGTVDLGNDGKADVTPEMAEFLLQFKGYEEC